MEFWGVEVKAGEPLHVPVEDGIVVHLSQAALGESKKDKGSEPVVVFVEFDEKKHVLGTLSRESIPQISLDVVFEKNFKLSHNWKHGSVYFCGYKADQGPAEESDDGFSDSEEDLTVPLQPTTNGKADVKAEAAKPTVKSTAAQVQVPEKKVKIADQQKEDKDSEDDDDSSDSGSDEDGTDKEMNISGDESDDGSDDGSGDDDDDEEEEPQPKGKKRTIPVQQKTPVPAKKSKPSTPQNTDSKKGAHTATPHPAKKAEKAGKVIANDKSPKSSGGQYSCKSCNKVCGSESGLEMHVKAKHSS